MNNQSDSDSAIGSQQRQSKLPRNIQRHSSESNSDNEVSQTSSQSSITGNLRSCFLLSICPRPRNKNLHLTRDILFEHFKPMVSEICIGMETNEETTYRVGFHFHIYLKLVQKMKPNTLHIHVQDFMEEVLGAECNPITSASVSVCDEDFSAEIDVKSLIRKSEKDTLRYVTKADKSPRFFNVNTENFSQYFQDHRFVAKALKRKEPPSKFDPYIYTKRSKNEVMELYNEQSILSRPKAKLERCDIKFGDWRDECSEWWNPLVDKINRGETLDLKTPCLLLIGRSNCGKSRFIFDMLLRKLDSWSIFTPLASQKYAWHKFDPRQHVVVVKDEFSIKDFDVNQWKLAVEGQTIQSDVKHKDSKEVKIVVPIIFLSNYELPKRGEKGYAEGVRKRCHIVRATNSIEKDMIVSDPYSQYVSSTSDMASVNILPSISAEPFKEPTFNSTPINSTQESTTSSSSDNIQSKENHQEVNLDFEFLEHCDLLLNDLPASSNSQQIILADGSLNEEKDVSSSDSDIIFIREIVGDPKRKKIKREIIRSF